METKQVRFGTPDQASKGRENPVEDVSLSEIEDPEERSLERLKRNYTPITN